MPMPEVPPISRASSSCSSSKAAIRRRQMTSRPWRCVSDQVGEPQDAQVPADERLRQAYPGRQLVDRHGAEFGEKADDPQPGLVTQGAVHRSQAAQVAFRAGLAGKRHCVVLLYQMRIDISGGL